jgi:hypothetical protein
MVEYSCLTCNFKTNLKANYTRHLETKKHKLNTEKKVNIAQNHNLETKKSEMYSKIIPKQSQNNPKIIPNFHNIDKIKLSGTNTIYKCEYCFKEFKHKNGLYKHINELRCKKLPKIDKELIIVSKKNKELEKKLKREKQHKKMIIEHKTNLNKSQNTTSNSYNNQIHTNSHNKITNNLNININALGEESLENISEREILSILNKAYAGIPSLIKKIHFDQEENRNIFQPNVNKPYIKYYNGNRWMSEKFDIISQKLFNNTSNVLEDWFEKYQSKMPERKQDLINNLIDDYNEGKIEDKFTDDLKLFLLDYSNEIKEHIVNEIKNSNLIELIN